MRGTFTPHHIRITTLTPLQYYYWFAVAIDIEVRCYLGTLLKSFAVALTAVTTLASSAVVIPNSTCNAFQYICAYQLHIILCLWRLSICAFLLHIVPIILRDVTYFHFVWFVMRQPNGIVKSLRAIKPN